MADILTPYYFAIFLKSCALLAARRFVGETVFVILLNTSSIGIPGILLRLSEHLTADSTQPKDSSVNCKGSHVVYWRGCPQFPRKGHQQLKRKPEFPLNPPTKENFRQLQTTHPPVIPTIENGITYALRYRNRRTFTPLPLFLNVGSVYFFLFTFYRCKPEATPTAVSPTPRDSLSFPSQLRDENLFPAL
ncbi:hypothetical protein CDAR_309391 [Caerostris darwini]|uniref:Uncharacterized protein n=1 Tax=Caerostris darwini TaxID=1538125 RepID=A0AAV4SE83_9ARAC|nr:hypothetical protein CDAR_309391 [Caerostris darwini]